ncbi:MAG: type I restriction-modification system subunit M N-terminal domain-containing protein [Terriglobales bacterium]
MASLANYTFLTSEVAVARPNVYAGRRERVLKGFSNVQQNLPNPTDLARMHQNGRQSQSTHEQLKQLEADLWRAADNLRANSDLKSSEYSTPVLGLIFLKFADNN